MKVKFDQPTNETVIVYVCEIQYNIRECQLSMLMDSAAFVQRTKTIYVPNKKKTK